MYEYDGHKYSPEEVQAAAEENQLSLEEYVKKIGMTLVEDTGYGDDHISRDDYEMRTGDKVEDNLVKKLSDKYKDFEFDYSTDGRDQISVKNSNGDSRDFLLDTDYNKKEEALGSFMYNGVPEGQESIYASYDDFITYIKGDKSSDDQKSNYSKTKLRPKDYVQYEVDRSPMSYQPSGKITREGRISGGNRQFKTVDAKEQKKLTEMAAEEMATVFSDMTLIGGAEHSKSAKATLTPELSHKLHKRVLQNIKERTGRNITQQSYNLMVGKGSASGLEANTKTFIEGQVASRQHAKRKDTEKYDGEAKSIYEQESKSFGNLKGKKFADKAKYNAEYQQLQIEIEDLERRVEDGDENPSSLEDAILSKEKKQQEIIESVKQLSKKTVRKRVSYDPMDIKRGLGSYEVEETDEEIGSMFITEGYREQSKINIEKSYVTTKNTIGLQTETLVNDNLNDYQAQKILQQDEYIRYNNLLKEGGRKTFKLDFSDYDTKTEINEGDMGMTYDSNVYDSYMRKIQKDPRFTINEDMSVTTVNGEDLNYNDLHSLGFTRKNMKESMFNTLGGKLSKEDIEWMRVHEEALDVSEGRRYALWEMTDLNIDPEKIKKKGNVRLFAEAAVKQAAVEMFGYSNTEADAAVAGISGKKFTTRFILDEMQKIEPVYNEVLKEEIISGKAKKFEFTEEQAEKLERTLSENVAEGVGHMVPTLVKLGIISAATGGVLSVTGGARVLGALGKGKGFYDKLKFHSAMLALEETKMQIAGFKPTSGAAFYVGGAATRGITPFGKRFTYLNPIWQKVLKGGPVGAASMELAGVTELWYEDLMGDKDFKSNFRDMYGDMGEVKERLLTNSLMFSMIGASHVKKTDFYSTGKKLELISDLEVQKLDILGRGKKGRNKKYENLTTKEKYKYDGLTETQAQLSNMVRLETMVDKLDPESKNFEAEFGKRYTEPLNQAIKKVIPEYKGFTVKFYEGGNAWRKRNFENPRNAAEFRVDKREVAIDKSMYEAGKEIHEFTHAAFRAVFDANPNLKLTFTKKMKDIFSEFDQLPGSNIKLTDAINTAIGGRKDKASDARTREGKDMRAEEFISYMVEFLSNPNVYYTTVGRSMVKDIKQEVTDIFEENFGYKPKIKNAGQFVDFLGRLAQGARRGTNITNKAGRMAQLDQIDFLGIEYKTGKKNDFKALASIDIVNRNKDLSKELISAREKSGIESQRATNVEGKLIMNNMGLISQFNKEFFKPELGGERIQFESDVMMEVVKVVRTYKPGEGKAEFGAYLNDALFGGGLMGPIGRQGNILNRFNKSKSAVKTVSIDADGSFLQLEGGISSGGSNGPRAAEAGLINLKNKLNLTDAHITSIENKVDVQNIDKYNYKNLQDLAPDITMEMFGGISGAEKAIEISSLIGKKIGKTSEVYTKQTATDRINKKYTGESNKNIEQKVQYIADKFEILYDLLPQGAMLKTGKTSIEGTSTEIQPSLLNGLLYNPSSRKGASAQASASKTGKTAGLPVQVKQKGLTKEQFLEKFGVFLKPDGRTVDFVKTKIKSQGKSLRAIDALIAEAGRSITNQVTRDFLEKPGNYEKNPELANKLSLEALLNQIKGGKSESLASTNLYDLVNKISKGNETEGIKMVGSFIRDRKSLLNSNPSAYGEIKDLIEARARVYADQGKSAEQFTTAFKKSKWKDLVSDLYIESDAKFKENPASQKRFQDMAFDLASKMPAIDILKQSGNAKMILDLFAGHYNIVGSAKAKVKGAFKKGIKKRLSENNSTDFLKSIEGNEKLTEQYKDISERLKNFDFELLKSSYASKFYTGFKKIQKSKTLAEQRKLAKEYYSTKEGKQQSELYDVWNSMLELWLHSKSEKITFAEKAGYIVKIKKANGAIGTTGERTLAPGGYVYLPGKTFEGTAKYEHLKSSSQQSLESLMLILDGSWHKKGKSTLKKYKGIYGILSDFNIIDKATGKVNNSDIFRFAENLELAKDIYKIDGKFKTSLYQEIVSKVGKEQVKKLEKIHEANILDKALDKARDQGKPTKGISVFDFDDTLAKTNSQIIVKMRDGKTMKINATEFAKRDAELTAKGAKYDFSEFNKVIDGKKGPLFDLAMKRQDKFSNKDIFVLTARPKESAVAIHKFLKGVGLEIPIKNITGLADGRAEAKAAWILEKASEGYNDFYFADDAIKNVKAVKSALTQIDVKSDVQLALASRKLDIDFNKIIEGSSGIAANKVYSKAKGQVRGANKGKFKFFIPPSAEDFVGLIYPTLGKGKVGDAQMAWYKKNLLDPFARAEANITKERHQLMKDFAELKKEIKEVPKGLRSKIKEGPAAGYTKEQAMRAYIWNKQGMKIPGLSKRDTKELVDFVKSESPVREFADKLILINKGDGYNKPSNSWLAGTITTDLIEGLNTTKRQKHLKEWQKNADIIFSEKNLNKYEAAYGSKARESMQNILGRMKTGQNRKKLGGAFQRLENEVLDWTNNSVGAIMFLNSRSAVLQTISAINYVNFKDNNPLAAAKAFGNQKQYWSDFKTLFNSEYLVQRRDGLKININEAEIVEAAANAKNPVKAGISYLLNKGFLMTRHADSFAISSGGAAFYRNRINTYLKQGLSESKAKEKAFRDFREVTEESQQSSRTDRISAQQASGLGRVVLAFANTPMQYARLQKRAIQDLANGRGDAKSNLSKITYYGFVQNLIFNALQQAVLAIGFDENPDDQQQIMDKSSRMINGMLDSQLRGLGYGGAAVSTVKNIIQKISEEHSKKRPKYENAAWEMLDFAPPISSKVTKMRSALRSVDYDLEDMKSKGFSLENPAYMAGAQVLSASANLPVDRVLKKMKNVQDAMDEDNEMWAKVALLSGWSEWELGISEDANQSKNTKKRNKSKSGVRRRY